MSEESKKTLVWQEHPDSTGRVTLTVEYDGVHFTKFPYSPYLSMSTETGPYTCHINNIVDWNKPGHKMVLSATIYEPAKPIGNTRMIHQIEMDATKENKDRIFIEAVEWMKAKVVADKQT